MSSHQAIRSSRAKPLSARSRIRTRGQRARICADDPRATSSTAPAAASMLARRSLADQQVPAAEHVERQIAVAVVVAVEEAPLLVAVQRIVGGIEIEDDLLGRPRVRLQEQVDEQRSRSPPVVADLVIARRRKLAQLQPVERRLAGHRRAVRAPRRKLARQHRQHRIVAQLVVVVEILVAERDAEHPLADQRRDLVLDQLRRAARRESRPQTDRSARSPDRSRPEAAARIRGHQPAIKRRFHSAAFDGSKIKPFCATLCRHRGSSFESPKSLPHNNFR